MSLNEFHRERIYLHKPSYMRHFCIVSIMSAVIHSTTDDHVCIRAKICIIYKVSEAHTPNHQHLETEAFDVISAVAVHTR